MRTNDVYCGTSSLHFINRTTGETVIDLSANLRNGLWKTFNLESYLYNDTLHFNEPHLQKPIFENFFQVIPGNKWDMTTQSLLQDLYTPNLCVSKVSNLIEESRKFFKELNAHRIGVHLSGGLDSSIVICLLKYLDIPFIPIGVCSNSFEFRTERYIQEQLLRFCGNGKLIDIRECPFYSNIEKIPIHSMPTGVIQSYALNERLASEFAEYGCDVVINGQGGDTLFVDGCQKMSEWVINIGYEFELSDACTLSYNPRNIRLISFYSCKPIIDIICSARLGEKDDTLKLWARKWLKSILPKELADYSYIGDFFAQHMQGLEDAKPIIGMLFEKAYDMTRNELFSPKNTMKFISQDVFNFEHKSYINFCSLLSAAVWYNSIDN